MYLIFWERRAVGLSAKAWYLIFCAIVVELRRLGPGIKFLVRILFLLVRVNLAQREIRGMDGAH